MTAQDLTLNIAVNLGRLSRWAIEQKAQRINQFLEETEMYLDDLEKTPKSERFFPTFNKFKNRFNQLKSNDTDEVWAEEMLTWANILTHRAKLA